MGDDDEWPDWIEGGSSLDAWPEETRKIRAQLDKYELEQLRAAERKRSAPREAESSGSETALTQPGPTDRLLDEIRVSKSSYPLPGATAEAALDLSEQEAERQHSQAIKDAKSSQGEEAHAVGQTLRADSGGLAPVTVQPSSSPTERVAVVGVCVFILTTCLTTYFTAVQVAPRDSEGGANFWPYPWLYAVAAVAVLCVVVAYLSWTGRDRPPKRRRDREPPLDG
jgi:hypothetical protein